jgi:CRP/FNR family transcriptional regulator, cyclic AMP receptor protein
VLTLIEKVIFLRGIDVFSEVPTEQLGYVATIAEQIRFAGGERIYDEGDPSDSMYVVIGGKVRLHRGEAEVMVAGERQAFGTWALFDDEPRLTTATALDGAEVLRVDKEDFIDLLADNVAITQGVLKAIVRRLRRVLDRFAPGVS